MILQNEALTVSVDPTLGASLMGLRVRRGTADGLALLPEPGSPGCDLAAASFVMAPYSNRIADGRFAFQGRTFQLADADKHAMHGCVRKRPWAVVAATATRATLRLALRRSADHARAEQPASTDPATFNWPWPFTTEVTYDLDGAALTSTLGLTNDGDSPMPAGFGFHPYFRRHLTREGEPVHVQFRTAGTYPDADGTRIPSGPARPDPAADYARARALDPDCFHDFCACGWDGVAGIAWPESRVRIGLAASPVLGHLVFYNPPKPWFAMEPVSNANDGVNLLARGDQTSGVRVLAPGERLEGAFRMTVEVR